jgi:hypothetical protein
MPSVIQVDVTTSEKIRPKMPLVSQRADQTTPLSHGPSGKAKNNNGPSREFTQKRDNPFSLYKHDPTTPSLISTDSPLGIQSLRRKAFPSKGCKPWPGRTRFRDRPVVGFRFNNRGRRLGGEVSDKFLRGLSARLARKQPNRMEYAICRQRRHHEPRWPLLQARHVRSNRSPFFGPVNQLYGSQMTQAPTLG